MAYTPDNVLARLSSGTRTTAETVDEHRARIQHILNQLEPMLPATHDNGQGAT